MLTLVQCASVTVVFVTCQKVSKQWSSIPSLYWSCTESVKVQKSHLLAICGLKTFHFTSQKPPKLIIILGCSADISHFNPGESPYTATKLGMCKYPFFLCCCRMMEVEVGHHSVLLTRCEGKFSAIGNQCTHYGAPLSKGMEDCYLSKGLFWLLDTFCMFSLSRSPYRPHSALPMAWRLFQCPNRGSWGIPWYRQFTMP